ncbi:MAG: MaoC family dehydratase N-terminal domain-containing protein [Nocardioidaceae bacterium]|nr:MaoC family dehydratase N-terminal domain-containing protein [Nocardioidaceae bacterium]
MTTDLPEEVARMVGVRQYRQTGPLVVDVTTIRNACASVENGNPLYWDEQLATELAGSPVAPQAMVSAWTRPFHWTPDPSEPSLPLQVHFDLKEALGFPEAIMSSDELVFHEPVRVGDRLTSTQVLLSVSEEKTTAVGRGRFWNIAVEYRNQDDLLCCREVIAGFGYRRAA